MILYVLKHFLNFRNKNNRYLLEREQNWEKRAVPLELAGALQLQPDGAAPECSLVLSDLLNIPKKPELNSFIYNLRIND